MDIIPQTKPLYNALAYSSTVTPNLILLFGMPRSGTTWIGKIFDSHPDTLYRHEPDSWGLLNEVPILARVEVADQYLSKVQTFIEGLRGMRHTKVSASLPLFPKSYYSPLQFSLRRFSVWSAKVAAKFIGELPVPQWLDEQDFANLCVVWKSIESTGRLGVIVKSAESCRAIHILRHPCGYAASVLRGESQGKFSGSEPSSEDYELLRLLLETRQAQRYGLTFEALLRMAPIERLAWRWVLFNEKAMNDVEGMAHCMQVRYEDICDAPEAMARKLFEFAGLVWNSQTENFIRNSTASEKSAYYSVYKDPRRAANKWREQLPVADAERVLNITRQSRPGQCYLAD